MSGDSWVLLEDWAALVLSRAERPESSRKAKDNVTLSESNETGIVGISVKNNFQRYLARCQEIRGSSWKTGQP